MAMNSRILTTPRGGNLLGIPDPQKGNDFNKLLETQLINVYNTAFNSSSGTLSFPINLLYVDPTELDITWRWERVPTNVLIPTFTIIPLPDGRGVNLDFGLNTIIFNFNAATRAMEISTSGSTSIVLSGVFIIKRRKRKIRSAGIIVLPGASSGSTLLIGDLPFMIKDPDKTWVGLMDTISNNLYKFGTWVETYIPTALDHSWHISPLSSGAATDIKIISPTQLQYGRSTLTLNYSLIEFQ